MSQPDQRIEWNAEIPTGAPMAIAHDALRLTSFGIEAGLWTLTAFAKSSLAWQRKLTEFASMRLDKDTEAARQLAGARDTSEVLRVQAEYFRTAAADYIQGTQQLMECGAEVSREILTPLKEQAEKAADEAERGAQDANIRADVAA